MKIPRNCLTFVIYARWRLKRGKIVIICWSGAWRKQEWPPLPHLGVQVDDKYIVHYQAHDRNLPLKRILSFKGKPALRRIK
jgi:hypothetical protein